MNKTADTILGFVLGLILFTFVGGFVGFLYQVGFWEVASKSVINAFGSRHRPIVHYSKKVTEFITKEEYERRTKLGWRIGYAVGAGIYAVGFLTLKALERGQKKTKGE